MKNLFLAGISALTVFSAQGRIGFEEARELSTHSYNLDPTRYLGEYDIIRLAAVCKHKHAVVPPDNLSNASTDCAQLAEFMALVLFNDQSKLSPKVYNNIEDSMIEIIEGQAKLSKADAKIIV